MACAFLPGADGGLSGLLDYVDCQAQTVGSQGYLALAAAGSPASGVLDVSLTILVAIYGYRLLLGHAPGVRDAVSLFVRIGIVFAFATNWSAYRTVLYDVVLHGPAELAGAIGGPVGLPGATGGLAAHIEATDRQFQALAVAGVGGAFPYQQSGIAPPPFFGFDPLALGTARAIYLVGAVGSFAAVRLTAGLLLALGPLFIAFLLFDATRGVFIGWLRVMIGASLGALATAIVLGTELALLEPWLLDLLARRAGSQAIPGAPTQLLALTSIFAIALVAAIGAVARIAWSLDLGGGTLFPSLSGAASSTASAARSADPAALARITPAANRARAAAIAEAVQASDRRDAVAIQMAPPSVAIRAIGQRERTTDAPIVTGGSIGRPRADSGRRTGTRVSISAGRRDVS